MAAADPWRMRLMNPSTPNPYPWDGKGTPSCGSSSRDELAELQALDAKINALLPRQYQYCYDSVRPVSMGSAGLKFGPDGKVAWDQIWTSFCDLALAGGPPHRGTLLEPASAEEALQEPEKYQEVVEEIGRGLWLTTRLPVLPHSAPGWVGVRCHNWEMAAWLVRAIVAENVFARHDREMLSLPAGPHFRLGKEIKNVVTVLAKTCHYWDYHTSARQREEVAATLHGIGEATLLEPATSEEARKASERHKAVVNEMKRRLRKITRLAKASCQPLGWIGVRCSDELMAVWLMRAVIAENVLARREGDVLFLPASPTFTNGDKIQKVTEAFARVRQLWDIHVANRRYANEKPSR